MGCITYAVTRVAAATGGGSQEITTTALCGQTPAAVFFTIVGATTDGTPAVHARMGFGAATSSAARWATACVAEDGQGTTDTSRRGATDECIQITDNDGAIDGEADFVQFIANGCEINWGDAPSSAWLIIAEFWAGTGLSALAHTFTLGNLNVEVNVNTVGFEPDVVLVVTPGLSSLDDTDINPGYMSHGVVLNGASVEQYCWCYGSESGAAASNVYGYVSDDYGCGQIEKAGAGVIWLGDFGSFDAQGFSCWARTGNSNDEIGCLSLAFNSEINFEAGVLATPTSTGSESVTDPGFCIQGAHLGLTQLTALDTYTGGGDGGSLGVAAFASCASAQYSSSFQDEDGQGTSDTQSLSDDQINLPNDDGSVGHVATITGLTNSGWDWNFSATEGTAVYWWYVAFGGRRVPAKMHHHMRC